MGSFELAPPHTHSRAANASYVLCFSCGAGMAYATDLVAQLTADEAAAKGSEYRALQAADATVA